MRLINKRKNYLIIHRNLYENVSPGKGNSTFILSKNFFSSVLSVSLRYDLKLINRTWAHQPNVNDFMDEIGQRLRAAIDICDKSPLGRISLVSCSEK